jgi:hypothetical protein
MYQWYRHSHRRPGISHPGTLMRTRPAFIVCFWIAVLAANSAFAQSWTHLSFRAGTAPVGRNMKGQPGAYDPYSDPNVLETATIPVAVAFTNKLAIGEVMATTPLDTVVTANETSHIQRFTDIPTAQQAYSITSCPAS